MVDDITNFGFIIFKDLDDASNQLMRRIDFK